MATQPRILFFLKFTYFFIGPLQYSCLKIPWTEESGRLQSMGSQRAGQDGAHVHWKQDHKETFSHSCSQQLY